MVTCTRVPTNYAYTRRQKRAIAKKNIEKAGKKRFCKHSYQTYVAGALKMERRIPSFFAENWRDYVEVD